MSCFFAVDSLVDFLAFAFALNTMFSFTRVRRRLLLKLQKEIQQSLDDLRPLVEDCRKSIREAEQFKVRISGVRILMAEILTPGNNSDSEEESTGGKGAEQVFLHQARLTAAMPSTASGCGR